MNRSSLKVSHLLAKFVGHRHCGSRDIVFSVVGDKVADAYLLPPLLFSLKHMTYHAHSQNFRMETQSFASVSSNSHTCLQQSDSKDFAR